MADAPLLSLRGVTKAYPGVIANQDVDLTVQAGEIHALLGENGAGKSTLVKMIYGAVTPDKGQMWFGGESYAPRSPNQARSTGVGMVFQHFSLFDAMTVAENIALGLPGAVVGSALSSEIITVSESYGLSINPDARIGTLSMGERQKVEIVRCLLQNPKLLIMDEPTSVLTPQEADKLFETLRKLASEGCAILYISHKLAEIRALCDAATVLRQGRVVEQCIPADETPASMAEMMIGDTPVNKVERSARPAEVRLVVDQLSMPRAETFGVDLKDISLTLRSGEILGVAGIAGNGQSELMDALIGERPSPAPTTIRLMGNPIGNDGPTRRRGKGMAFIPEERLGHGAVPAMSLLENTFVTARKHRALEKAGFMMFGAAARFADEVIDVFRVRAGRAGRSEAGSLSGGNLQKFIVGREILQDPAVLVASQPTWGVDAGAAAEIHNALLTLADAGTAILILSQDLDELRTISDRIAVIAGGRLSPAYTADELSVEQIGLMMGGEMPMEAAE